MMIIKKVFVLQIIIILLFILNIYKNIFNLANKGKEKPNTNNKNRNLKNHETNYSYFALYIKEDQMEFISKGLITNKL